MSIITEALTKAQEKRKNEAHKKAEEKIVEPHPWGGIPPVPQSGTGCGIKIQTSIPDIKKETMPIREIRSAFNIKSVMMLVLIVAASAAILIFMPFTHKPASTANKPVDPPIAQTPPSPSAPQGLMPYKFNLTSHALEFNLEGVISGNGAPAAIINKQVVGVGDTVKGAVVMDIKEDEVILDYNGEEITLEIK